MSLFTYQLGYTVEPRARIYKRLRSPGIDSKESVPPAYAAWRTGTTNSVIIPGPPGYIIWRNRFLGIDS
jgi:hypothetical protein